MFGGLLLLENPQINKVCFSSLRQSPVAKRCKGNKRKRNKMNN